MPRVVINGLKKMQKIFAVTNEEAAVYCIKTSSRLKSQPQLCSIKRITWIFQTAACKRLACYFSISIAENVIGVVAVLSLALYRLVLRMVKLIFPLMISTFAFPFVKA